jgi:kanamycin kinase
VDAVPASLRTRFDRHEWRPVTGGLSGAGVWRLHGSPDCFVKLAPPSAHRDTGFDLRAEAERLAWLGGRGLPVPEVVDVGSDGAMTWLVTTAVPGRSAAQTWPREQHTAVVDALADMVRALHALPVESCPFDRSLAVTLPDAHHAAEAGLIELDELDDERAGWTTEQLLAELEATRPAVEELVVCHGDLCLPNVLLDPGTLGVTGLIDLGRLGRADRYSDLALVTRSLVDDLDPELGPGLQQRFLARYGEPDVDPARLAFYRLLDEFF